MAQGYGYAANAAPMGAPNPRDAITDALMRIQRPPPAPPWQSQPDSAFGQAPSQMLGAMPIQSPGGPVPPSPMGVPPTLPGMPSPMQAAGAATPGGVVANAASPFPQSRPYGV